MNLNQKRKPISVSTTSIIENGQVVYLTNAVCDDGTIWELTDVDEGWKQLPSIPGTKPYNEEELKVLSKVTSPATSIAPISADLGKITKGISSTAETTKAFCEPSCVDKCTVDCKNPKLQQFVIEDEDQLTEALEMLVKLFFTDNKNQ